MLVPVAIAAVLVAACESSTPRVDASGSESASGSSPTTPSVVPTPSSATPTPPAVPTGSLPRKGEQSATCVNGWVTPQSDSHVFTDPLGVIRRTTGVQGPLVVVDMRFFVGPESPPSDKGYLLDIQRWYIKLYAKDDLSFQGRFLVEFRRFGRGLSAVAPYDTSGWQSPDWRGFQYASEDHSNRDIPGLPGTWSGVEYDYVKGGAGITIPGLPDQVVGCLSGT
jgi:hypothetical protein